MGKADGQMFDSSSAFCIYGYKDKKQIELKDITSESIDKKLNAPYHINC